MLHGGARPLSSCAEVDERYGRRRCPVSLPVRRATARDSSELTRHGTSGTILTRLSFAHSLCTLFQQLMACRQWVLAQVIHRTLHTMCTS